MCFIFCPNIKTRRIKKNGILYEITTKQDFIWVSVIALVLITYKPAEWLTSQVVKEGDSFGPHILINIIFTVFLMSIFLTVIGTWIGSRHISMEPIRMFFYKWPRNFAISFFVEACIAQPIARVVMLKKHQYQDSKAQ